MSELKETLGHLDNALSKLAPGETHKDNKAANGDTATFAYDWRKDSLYGAVMRLAEKRSRGLIPRRVIR